jgi:hypothetical protein
MHRTIPALEIGAERRAGCMVNCGHITASSRKTE